MRWARLLSLALRKKDDLSVFFPPCPLLKNRGKKSILLLHSLFICEFAFLNNTKGGGEMEKKNAYFFVSLPVCIYFT